MSRVSFFDSIFGPPGHPHRGRWIVLAAVLTGLVIVVPILFVVSTVPSPSPPTPTFPIVPASLGETNGSAVPLYSGFLGVNLRPDFALTASALAELNSTGVRLVRWPGGALGDRYDPIANGGQGVIYTDSGQPLPAATSLGEFVAWCQSTSCRSVITLPAEIDNASLAAAIVSYTETTLGFRPTYWEIGNEPALWSHFGIPWPDWQPSQNSTVTPQEYATVVASYVRAIRSVDPVTGIIGIGGIGTGAADVSTWFDPTLELDGPNLSAMAIHVYPAGNATYLSGISAWFSTLRGTMSGLPARVENAQSVMQQACPSCRLTLLVDEFQTGTDLTSATALSGGYLATYVAAEIVQALSLPIVSLDYFDFQGVTPGAWLGPTGAGSASLALYQALESRLGALAVQLRVNASIPGLLAAQGGNSTANLGSLLLVNTNSSVGFALNLSDRLSINRTVTAWQFNGSSPSPGTTSVSPAELVNWTIPPASMVLLTGLNPLPASSEGNSRATPVPLSRTSAEPSHLGTIGRSFEGSAAVRNGYLALAPRGSGVERARPPGVSPRRTTNPGAPTPKCILGPPTGRAGRTLRNGTSA